MENLVMIAVRLCAIIYIRDFRRRCGFSSYNPCGGSVSTFPSAFPSYLQLDILQYNALNSWKMHLIAWRIAELFSGLVSLCLWTTKKNDRPGKWLTGKSIYLWWKEGIETDAGIESVQRIRLTAKLERIMKI